MTSALIASSLLIAASCLVSEFLRIIINTNVKAPLSKLLCLEFVASAELCAVCFELIVGKPISILGFYKSNQLNYIHMHLKWPRNMEPGCMLFSYSALLFGGLLIGVTQPHVHTYTLKHIWMDLAVLVKPF